MSHSPIVAAPAILDCNLEALRARQPALAVQIAEAPFPASIDYSESRDGTPNYRLVGVDDARQWLGRTSMPRVRAEALVEGLGDDAGNVLVWPFGNGMEAFVRLERTASHCAVFAYDSDPVALRLALSLRDFGEALRGGQLVLLCGADPARAIVAFFDVHPGYEFPQKLLALPYVSRGDVETIRQAMDVAGAEIVRMQTECVQTVATRLNHGKGYRGEIGGAAILTVDPRSDVIETAAALRHAMGAGAVVSTPDRPETCHHLARLQALSESGVEAAVLLNCGWGTLVSYVPQRLPAASWLLPEAPLLRGMTDGFGPHHVVFASTPELCDRAIAGGVDVQRVRLLEIGVDDAVFRRLETAASTMEAVLIGDVADLRPEAYRIELSSQVAIWKAICVEAANRLYGSANEIMSAAERSSGVTIGDERLRSHLLFMIRQTVMPTLVRRAAAQALHDGGVDVHVFGRGWSQSRMPSSRVHESPSSPAFRNELFNAAEVVVCPWMDDRAVRVCLEASAAGGCVVTGPRDASFIARHPQLFEVLEALPAGDSPQSIRKYVRAFVRDASARESACSDARVKIAEGHTIRHRWTAIRSALAEIGVDP